jgi:hypothetical protein
MLKATLCLYVVSFDLDKNERCFVSTKENQFIPLSTNLIDDSLTIDQALENLFEQYIELGFGWVKTKFLDITKQEGLINIHYACSIPPDTPLKNAYYNSANIAIINRFVRKAILYV